MEHRFIDVIADKKVFQNSQGLNLHPIMVENNLNQLVAMQEFFAGSEFMLLVSGFLGVGKSSIVDYFSNFLTCFLNVGRLIKVSRAKLKTAQDILLPLISAFCISLLADTFLRIIPIKFELVYIILLCLICLPFYVLTLFLFGTFKKEEIKGFLK